MTRFRYRTECLARPSKLQRYRGTRDFMWQEHILVFSDDKHACNTRTLSRCEPCLPQLHKVELLWNMLEWKLVDFEHEMSAVIQESVLIDSERTPHRWKKWWHYINVHDNVDTKHKVQSRWVSCSKCTTIQPPLNTDFLGNASWHMSRSNA